MIVNVNDEIKNAVSMIDVCERYGIELNRSGYMVCPFHGEKTGSLKVYPGRRGWHCFGCHEGGDVIDFVQRYFNLTLPQAQKKINEDFNLRILMGQTDYRSRMAAGRAAAERRRAADMRRQDAEKTEQRYWTAFDRVNALRAEIEAKKPISPDAVPSEAWLRALTDLSGAELALEEAERERMQHDQYRDRAG